MNAISKVCAAIAPHLAVYNECLMSERGDRIRTQCLYPSHQPVHIYVAGIGDGFWVHDNREAVRVAQLHGQSENVGASAVRAAAEKFGLNELNGQLRVQIENAAWLNSAIVSVANASAFAARDAVSRADGADRSDYLKGLIADVLLHLVGGGNFETNKNINGASGRRYRFDFALQSRDQTILIDGVTPHSNSVSAKYVAFSDAGAHIGAKGYAVMDTPLSQENKVLLSQVADVVPIKSLETTLGTYGGYYA